MLVELHSVETLGGMLRRLRRLLPVLLGIGALSVFLINIALQLQLRASPARTAHLDTALQRPAALFPTLQPTGRRLPRICIAGAAPTESIAQEVARAWPVWSFWTVLGDTSLPASGDEGQLACLSLKECMNF